MNDFHYSMSLLETLYGITMQEEQFEEIALTGWNLIGNKRTKLYKYKTCPDPITKSIELPCNADILEAVTTNFEEWDYSTNDTPNGNLNSAFVESYIEHRKAFNNPLYISGKFVKYERVGNTLYFEDPHDSINILYRGLILDNDGLPQITDKEAVALATYCAYIHKFREGLMTNNKDSITLSNMLKDKWNLQCDLARIDYNMTQNDWDEILDAKTSWNRKIHGKTLKVYR